MATPHVAGAAGLLATAYPDLTAQELKERLLRGAEPVSGLAGRVAVVGRLQVANALESDATPPATACDLRVARAGSTRVEMALSAPGDDGWSGRATAYDLRRSHRPIDETNFDQAVKVESSRPGPPGKPQTLSVGVTPYSQQRLLYFGLKTIDNVGNRSGLATVRAVIPAAETAFEDNFDEANDWWSADGTWARVESPGRGFIFSDSPGEEYQNEANTSLTSIPISLAPFTGSTLLFEASHALEPGYDRVLVEASRDGQTFQELHQFTDRMGWSQHRVDLSDFDGQTVQLRFRLLSDQSVTADGFSLDNLVIVGDRGES